jgi:hypothetical protein
MTTTRIRVFAVTALLSVAGAVFGGNGETDALKAIANYRTWTRVTDKPIAVTSFTAAS